MRHPTVAQVMAKPSQLLPEDTHQSAAEQPGPRRTSANCTNRERNGAEEKGGHPSAQLGVIYETGPEEALAQHLLPQVPEVRHVRLHDDVSDFANQVCRQHGPVHTCTMVIGKDVRGILPSHVHDGANATRVCLHKGSDVINALIADDPTIFRRAVFRHLCYSKLWQRLALEALWQARVHGLKFAHSIIFSPDHAWFFCGSSCGCRPFNIISLPLSQNSHNEWLL
mmetsp:Transcript_65563/g.129182  ORF Transcript_65563/g.129182 Transcript_65563/m.129182 type:complete len:225 (+) Transcript_65563:190-864(+)